MSRILIACIASALCAAPVLGQQPSPSQGERALDERRAELVREIELAVRATRRSIGKSELDRRVMGAIAAVPRHEFVPAAFRDLAYHNRPLPIGEGQTISQPYIVALMTDLARVDEGSVVLEVGTGSGYQAAVLAEIAEHVYTIEIVEGLGRRAAETLERLGYDNVTVRIGDGYRGWPEQAPFDAIVVTAAPEEIPEPLIDQLARGGRLVVPVGAQGGAQSLQLLEKDDAGDVRIVDVLPVSFVPFTRDDE
jgi:protein-L-isoaspartate(D-aspartate) O-methyltransferase